MWTQADLALGQLTARERAAVTHISRLARAYSRGHRFRHAFVSMKVRDWLAPVLTARQPLILAHAIVAQPGLAGVWRLLRDEGADLDAIDRIITLRYAAAARPVRRSRRRSYRAAAGCATDRQDLAG